MNTPCTHIQKQLVDLLLDNLDKQQTETVHQHLNSCSVCQSYFEQYQNQEKELEHMSTRITNNLHEKQNKTIEALHTLPKAKHVHLPLLKYAAAAIIVVVGLIFFNTKDSTLYAQAVKAMEKARTVHATGYGLQNGKMVKANEIWYKRNVGYKMIWKHKDAEKLMIDNGQFLWKYQTGQDFAIKSKSISTERLPKEITETSRYLDKCIKEQDRIDIINGTPCQVYIGSYPNKPDSTRLIFWVDENLRPRQFEEKTLESGTWKVIERIEIEYDREIDIAVFKPNFSPDVEIIREDKILDENFSLDNAIFTREEMGLIFAVHEVQKCQNDVILTITSLRPNQELDGKFANKGFNAWNYGRYEFGTCYERFNEVGEKIDSSKYGPNDCISTSYIPVGLAWFYREGFLVRWTAFIPRGRGFKPGQVDKVKLELQYLRAEGSWAAERKAKGLKDRMVIKPVAILPLPDTPVSLEGQLNKIYNQMKLLEPMQADKHLELKCIPFTDEEMDTFIKDHPNDGIAKIWKEGNKSSRLSHGQSKKPGQISFEDWLEDRMEEIKKYQNQ